MAAAIPDHHRGHSIRSAVGMTAHEAKGFNERHRAIGDRASRFRVQRGHIIDNRGHLMRSTLSLCCDVSLDEEAWQRGWNGCGGTMHDTV
ncbi:hypothetical protein MTO96_023709 [Rhipicephalus appendiculatus]